MVEPKTKDTGHGTSVFKDGKRIIGLPKETLFTVLKQPLILVTPTKNSKEEYNAYKAKLRGERQA